jgi:hypothetical protein
MEAVDRRSSPRTPVHVYFNKYIDGVPYLCEALELSMSGMLVRRVNEPDRDLACYAVELAAEGEVADAKERVWLCASPVWSCGRFEALTFVGQSHIDRLRLADLVARLRGPARAIKAVASEAVIAEEPLDS